MDAVITKFESPSTESLVVNDNGRCMLSPGIYKVLGDLPVIRLPAGSIAEFDVVAIGNDKDPWPDPPAKFQSTFSNVSLEILRGFFPNASAFSEIANDPTE